MKADALALGAIALWASLATLAVFLSDIPPFLMTGIGLIIGSLISLPLSGFKFRSWKVPVRTLVVGVYGLFGYHLLLFIALKTAPAIEANLVNYLWPLLIVLLTPLFSKALKLSFRLVVAALLGFAGAATAILSAGSVASVSLSVGFLFALGAAVVWATYSLLTTKVPHFQTSAIGLFALISGALALISHFLLEPQTPIEPKDWIWLILLGVGPLGGAFYFWDAALKIGDPRRIGLLAFATPLLSTGLLVITSGRSPSWQLALATLLIVGAALIGSQRSKSLVVGE